MFGLAYVILPFSPEAPAEAIRGSLARFKMGRRGDVPDSWLTFHDETAKLRECYERTYSFTRGQGLLTDGELEKHLSVNAIVGAMEDRGRQNWTVRFADIEPDFSAFVQTYGALKFEYHPVTGSFGRWLNGLGRWDWWELGGCYNGQITGHKREPIGGRATIDSGYSAWRESFEKLASALAGTLNNDPLLAVDIATDDNIELVSTLSVALAERLSHAFPAALVLPPGSVEDEERWLDIWPNLYALAWPDDRKEERQQAWDEILRLNYERFHDHWAAAVAYHF